MHDPTNRKVLSALCHLAIFFNPTVISVGLPIGVLLLSEDPVVRANAREAINFHLFVWLGWAIAGALSIVCIGLPLLVVMFVASLVLPAWAILCVLSDPNVPYTYPLTIRLL